MDGGHRLRAPVIIEPAVNLEDAFLGAEHGFHGRSAQAANEAWLDSFDLAKQKGRAGFDFVALGSAVSGRATFYDVADVNITAFDADELQHAVEQLARAPHERQALLVFVGARPFTHENQLRFRITLAKHYGLAARRQAAALAISQVRANLL